MLVWSDDIRIRDQYEYTIPTWICLLRAEASLFDRHVIPAGGNARHATGERTLALPYLEISRINSVIAEFVEISRINSVIADCCLNLRFLKRIKINIIYYNNL